jgi:hypothetical protein
MSDLIPVKDHLGLLRDPKTNAIINSNNSQYNSYIRLKEQKEKEKEKYYNFEEELSKVKNDIEEIKSLLKNFIDGCK